jgi:hypothetical protein
MCQWSGWRSIFALNATASIHEESRGVNREASTIQILFLDSGHSYGREGWPFAFS